MAGGGEGAGGGGGAWGPGEFELAGALVGAGAVRQAAGSGPGGRRRRLRALLSSRALPRTGWPPEEVEAFVRETALLDHTAFVGLAGMGEREGRVFAPAVARRYFGLAHGMGRSGDVTAEQPKACGSSLLAKLTNLLARDALREAGLRGCGPAVVLPLATGMSLVLALQALRRNRPPCARFVLWPRVDQKTGIKCVSAAGLELVVVPNRVDGDRVCTDLAAVERAVDELGADAVVGVLSTTACFAPREPDDVVGLAALCQRLGVGHVVNNAYGVQEGRTCAAISRAWAGTSGPGRVDAVVQSTDKNFLVPVGGSVVVGPKGRPGVVEGVARMYPGRASLGPSLDLLMTLLEMGAVGWRNLLDERRDNFEYLRRRLKEFAEGVGERVLDVPGNSISLAMTLSGVQAEPRQATQLGSMLFRRNVTGCRAFCPPGKTAEVDGRTFINFGSHTDAYPHAYLNVAAAVGMQLEEVDLFIRRLRECWEELVAKQSPQSPR